MLEPDHMRGTPLDMDQYTRLFGTARIPTEVRYPYPYAVICAPIHVWEQRGCKMEAHSDSRHVVILRRGQFCKSRSVSDDVFCLLSKELTLIA